MIIQDVITQIEALAPLHYAEDFDNVGLLVGNKNDEVKGVLITLDTLEAVVDEAISKDCNLIISFHPIIFKGLKKLNGSTYVERVVIKAIQNNIAIYAIHTALDNCIKGVNDIICDTLGLKNKKILLPQQGTIKKLTTFVPTADAKKLRDELFNAGAGSIGNYDNCSFNIEGVGTYQGNDDSKPVKGEKGEFHQEEETQISVTFQKHLESKILKSLFEKYESIAHFAEIRISDGSKLPARPWTIYYPQDKMQFLDYFKIYGFPHFIWVDGNGTIRENGIEKPSDGLESRLFKIQTEKDNKNKIKIGQ